MVNRQFWVSVILLALISLRLYYKFYQILRRQRRSHPNMNISSSFWQLLQRNWICAHLKAQDWRPIDLYCLIYFSRLTQRYGRSLSGMGFILCSLCRKEYILLSISSFLGVHTSFSWILRLRGTYICFTWHSLYSNLSFLGFLIKMKSYFDKVSHKSWVFWALLV